MTDNMKARHLAALETDAGRDVYEKLYAICEGREGGCDEAQMLLIDDYANNYELKLKLRDDLKKRGLGKEYHNSKQSYYKRNDSLSDIRAVVTQQLQVLKALKLTPEARKLEAAAVPEDEDGDDLDEF